MINIQSKNGNSKFFLLTLLGMLTAFGPFVTDMYLPSLPSMGEYFKTTPSLVQLGLTASMIGLTAGQIFFGPLSDKYGRRSPLLAAMYLFIISTIGCIFAPTIEIFAILRLLQGIVGAGGIVISRSVATDMFTGKELAKTLAIIGAINGVAPVAAPIIGGELSCYWDAGLSVRFRRPENNTLASSIGMLVLSIIVCIAMNLNCNFWIYEGLLITLLFMMGFSFTSTTALAMECEREHAGTASALSGAVGFGFGGLVSPLVGLDDTMVTTGIVFMACATCSLGCILWARKINAFREVSPIMRKRATFAPA